MIPAVVHCPSCSSSTTVIGTSRHFAVPRWLRWLRWLRVLGLDTAWYRHECWDCGVVYRTAGPASRMKPRQGRVSVWTRTLSLPIATPADEIAASIAQEQRRRGGRPALRPVARFAAEREVLQRDAQALGRAAVAQLKGRA